MNNPIFLTLSDTSLPLGSFAFSNGLESYTSHHPSTDTLTRFLHLSLLSLSTSTLPFVYAAYAAPKAAQALDDTFDATTTCPVARRASVSQGRALLTVWERALRGAAERGGEGVAGEGASGEDTVAAVETYRRAVKRGEAHGHFAVAWGVVTRAFSLGVEDVVYVFVFNHVKAVVSAGVRLGVIGPYGAQGILVAEGTRGAVERAVKEGRGRGVDECGQCVPSLDVYQGRHELLYSRVFNS